MPTALAIVVGLALFVGLPIAGFLAANRDDDGPRTIVRPTADVVVAMRDLARLEAASYHVERVVDLTDQSSALFGLVPVEDAILLVAAADAVAGVDLSHLREEDLVIDATRTRVTIRLPEPELFSVALDNQRTYVHTRRTDVLAQASPTLETRARQEAERTMREAAVQAGILDRARENARRTVGALLRSLGFSLVEVKFADE